MIKLLKWLFSPDRFVFYVGGGGGSGGGSAPAFQTQISDLPEWAKPYAKETLGKAQALTDINQNPYQTYGGERIAGFTPMQQQAMQTAASPEAFGREVQGYMSPYMQNVVDVQKREAMRGAGILGAQQQARATGAGAFGGYREGIQRAEDTRNLMTQLGDIQAVGSQRAFEQGTQQARLAQGLQMQYGGMEQGLEQQRLSQNYQDFLNQQRYPYQQLEFMSNIMRGTPMGTVQSMYAPPPSMLGQLGGLGLGFYGLNQAFKKEGGAIKEYADGGSVDAPDNVAKIVSDLSDAQLAQAKQAALVRGDEDQLDAIQREESMRASERSGLASAFNSLPYGQQEQMMAGGGVVAFSNGGDSSYDELEKKRLEQPRPAPRPRPAPSRRAAPVSPEIHQGINIIAEQTGQSRESLQNIFDSYRNALKEESAASMKELSDLAEKSMGGSKAVKEQALGRALADFGFKWAASAAEPGAGFLRSASKSAPTLAASIAESNKLAREMDQNDARMQMTMKQFEIAQRKGDLATASQLAGQERQLMQSQEQLGLQRQQLEETKRANIAKERLTGQRYAASAAAASDRMARIRSQLAIKAAAEAKDYDDPLKGIALKKMYPSRQAYQRALFEQMWAQSIPLEHVGVKED